MSAVVMKLTTILVKLASLVQHQLQLHKSVRQDVAKVTHELERIRAFLLMRESNNAASEHNPQHQVWVDQVREAASESEEILDECISGQQGASRSWFNFKARQDIASRIKRIISLFEQVPQSSQRYSAFDEPENVWWQCSRSHALLQSHSGQDDAYFVDEADLVGMKKRKDELIQLILNGNSALEVVSVVGMAGMGKTALVKKLFDDAEVKKRFQCHAWIAAAQAHNPQDILRDLIYKLHKERLAPVKDEDDRLKRYAFKKKIDESLQHMTALELKQEIRELLQSKSYLIVLDDLRSVYAWNALKFAFPETDSQSRVVITTRIAEVASRASTSERHVYNSEKLSEADSWTLFCRKVFASDDCPRDLLAACRSILKRCDGLPLAIATISDLLRNRDVLSELEAIDDKIGHESVANIVHLSYDDLPDHLRPCYQLLSIYP